MACIDTGAPVIHPVNATAVAAMARIEHLACILVLLRVQGLPAPAWGGNILLHLHPLVWFHKLGATGQPRGRRLCGGASAYSGLWRRRRGSCGPYAAKVEREARAFQDTKAQCLVSQCGPYLRRSRNFYGHVAVHVLICGPSRRLPRPRKQVREVVVTPRWAGRPSLLPAGCRRHVRPAMRSRTVTTPFMVQRFGCGCSRIAWSYTHLARFPTL